MRGLVARGWVRLLVIGVGIGFGSGCQKAGDGGSTQGTATNGGSTLAPPQEWDNPCAPLANGSIVFEPPSGTFDETVTVELRAADPAGEIRYTLDHTPPTLDSPLYEAPLVLSTTTEIRAQVFVGGEAHGPPQTGVYLAANLDERHDLPVLVLDSFGHAVPGADPNWEPSEDPFSREYVSAAVVVFEPNDGVTSFDMAPVVATGAGIHVRGQSSAAFAKKPYRVELRDATNADRDCPMFGLPPEADWVLNPPFSDKALIRNSFVYSLGLELDLAAPRSRLVEVYINSEPRALSSSDYQGVYLFVETIKNQKHRLNLQQLEPSDTMLPEIQGGYIFKFEWEDQDPEQSLQCPEASAYCWDWLEVADPKPWNSEQQAYLASHLAEFAAALHSGNPADPTLGYPAFIDTASFVDHVIVNELTRNLDAYLRSQYFHKDRNSKIFAGPLWDFDAIAGVGSSRGEYENLSTEGWQHAKLEQHQETADWFYVLLNDATFQQGLVTRWRELRGGVLADAEIVARIERLTRGLANAAQRNFDKWPILISERIRQFETPTADTWRGQVEVMQDWLLRRAAWLDTQW